MMVFKVQFVFKFFFQCLIILLLFFNNVQSDDSVRLKWLELVPKYAYDFVPESGVTEEMWEDEVFRAVASSQLRDQRKRSNNANL